MKANIIMHTIAHTVIKSSVWLIILCFVFVFSSCFDSDDVGDNYYTFTGEMMGEYLRARPAQFSEFTKMLDTTGVIGLLNAYGKYTCFAPTNEALLKFYQTKGRNSIAQFPMDTIKKMVYDHLINEVIIPTSEFKNGRIAKPSMSDRYISTKPAVNDFGLPVIMVNDSSAITDPDNEVHNGIVHIINSVLEPTVLKIKEKLERLPRYKLFFQALMATELYKELELVEDQSFAPLSNIEKTLMTGDWVNSYSWTPQKKMYGYTILTESDSTYEHIYGIKDLTQLAAYAKQVYDQVYPEDAGITDITDRRNSLNRFVAYHLLDRQVNYNKFVYKLVNDAFFTTNGSHLVSEVKIDMFDYIETMCPNTLLEVRTLRSSAHKSGTYGIFNMTDLAGIDAVRMVDFYTDIDSRNGVIHEIDKILVYSKEVISSLTSKRIRLDAGTFFSELTNNNMRGISDGGQWLIPHGYLKNMEFSQGTQVKYLSPFDRYCNFQGDEIFSSVQGGIFDVTMTTPPIPAGTYEVRFGYLNNNKRGIVQIYFDGQPCGIPVDLNLNFNGSDPYQIIGWVKPGNDPLDPQGTENDKMMHNRGFMKGPASIQPIVGNWQPMVPGRSNPNCLRRVLGVYTFAKDGPHKLKCKAAESNGEFMFDYLEFVPMEAIEQEDIY